MSTEIEDLSASFGPVKRELKDARAVLSRLDHQIRKLLRRHAAFFRLFLETCCIGHSHGA